MIIDSHVHIGNWDYEWYSYAKGGDPSDPFSWMDKAVFIPNDQKQDLKLLEKLRKEIDSYNRFFIPWFDPRDLFAMEKSTIMREFIENNIDEIHGLKIHPSIDQVIGGPANRVYSPLLALARSYKLPLLVHCCRHQETAGYSHLIAAARRNPELKFIGAHLGGDKENLKILAPRQVKEEGLTNVWFDISATREWWTIGMAIEQMGIERIIFGSDYPVMHPAMSIESVKALKLTRDEEDRIFYKNILEVFKR